MFTSGPNSHQVLCCAVELAMRVVVVSSTLQQGGGASSASNTKNYGCAEGLRRDARSANSMWPLEAKQVWAV